VSFFFLTILKLNILFFIEQEGVLKMFIKNRQLKKEISVTLLSQSLFLLVFALLNNCFKKGDYGDSFEQTKEKIDSVDLWDTVEHHSLDCF
jgi:hypothetical protein